MFKTILFAIFFAFASIANAQVYIQGQVYGPGYSIGIHSHQQVYPTYPAYRADYPRRHYVEPPRRYEPRYKDRHYYNYRNSCFDYPIHNRWGQVIGFQQRCY